MRRGQNWVAQDLDGTRSRLSRLKSVPRSLLLTQNHPKSDHFSISHDFGVPPCLFGNLHILYQNPVRVVVAHSWNFPQPNSAPNSPRYAGSCSRQFKRRHPKGLGSADRWSISPKCWLQNCWAIAKKTGLTSKKPWNSATNMLI